MAIRIKRVYQHAAEEDGVRILVDRLWPRGLSKDEAAIDSWLKELAPSTELRKWFGHETEKWEEFRQRYLRELKDNQDQLALVQQAMKQGTVTLLYSAKDKEHNNAVVLQEFLNDQLA